MDYIILAVDDRSFRLGRPNSYKIVKSLLNALDKVFGYVAHRNVPGCQIREIGPDPDYVGTWLRFLRWVCI